MHPVQVGSLRKRRKIRGWVYKGNSVIFNNMDISHLKTQILTMFMMNPNKTGGHQDIYAIIYSMLIMNFVEVLFKYIPEFLAMVKLFGNGYLKKQNMLMPILDMNDNDKKALNSITMSRVYSDNEKAEKSSNIYVEKVDAVLDYICSLDKSKHIRIDTRINIINTDEIELTPALKAKVKESAAADEGRSVDIVIFSKLLKISEIQKWIDEIHTNYTFEKNNKLGNRIYYFNEVSVEPAVQVEMDAEGGPIKKSYRWDTLPKMLSFNMNEFNTAKSFNNVYGTHVNELKERLDLFINHPEWYTERGIPYSLGIMFHGIPGAGKTSTIKAIAKDTHRHIFNLSLRPFTSQRQLTNLFFSETVVIYGHDGNKMTLKIPLNRRVYVIEDIDCLTDVVIDRAITGDKAVEGDAVTLSFLLNLLDGVLETPGRILIITSNFPEKLDKAFVRPGRIDVKVKFMHAELDLILEMVNKFYSISYGLDMIPECLDSIFTPAEIMESLCTYFKDPMEALDALVVRVGEKQKTSSMGTILNLLDEEPVEKIEAVVPKTIVHSPVEMKIEISEIEQPTANVSLHTNIEEVPKNVAVKPVDEDVVFTAQGFIAKGAKTNNGLNVRGFGTSKYDRVTYEDADFGNADFLPGFNIPGEMGVASSIDLNLIN
jgi:ATP-dependent 26S proteasome regulatory subunit